MPPEADEQERRQAGHLPEHHHQQQVFRQHHTEHGAHEQQQEGIETPAALVLAQVVAGIEDHQQTDAEDQQGKQEAQAVQTQAEVEPQIRQPGLLQVKYLAGEYRRTLPKQQYKAQQRCQGCSSCAQRATVALGQQGHHGTQQWQRNQ
ncbi:hypothetical protein D9M71_195420 [compost metagenome]